MLNKDQLDALNDAAGKMADPINEYLIADIARRVAGAGQLTSTAAYEVYRAQQLGLSRKEIEEKLKELLKVDKNHLEKLLTQSAEVGYNFDLANVPTYAVPFADNATVQQIVAAAVKLAQDDFTNITQTLGMIDHTGRAMPLQQAYRSAMDFAFKQVSTGAADYNTAIRQATKDVAAAGVRVIDYESGVHTSLEAAVRRCVMGGIGLMTEQIAQANHDMMGATGWEISAHAASAPDHEPIQGKQYTDAEFNALNNSLIRRIGTLNCGHVAFPIVYGVTKPQYTEEQLQQFREENAAGVTFEGKQYSMYEATQFQRRMERGIRRQKRIAVAAEAGGDKDKLLTSQIRLQTQRQNYKRFSKAADLRTQQERLDTVGFGRKESNAARAGAEGYYREWSKSVGTNNSAKTLAHFYDLKYNNSPEYELLQRYVRDVNAGWISPTAGFDNYSALYHRIETEIIGQKTSNGVTITGQSEHFMQRVLGTMTDPEKGKPRSGVSIEDIQDALFNPKSVDEPVARDDGLRSIKFRGAACDVTINPDSGSLIQTNPRKKR